MPLKTKFGPLDVLAFIEKGYGFVEADSREKQKLITPNRTHGGLYVPEPTGTQRLD